MKKALNVLSLFDGLSCGRIALDRAGVEVENYYASEVDRNPIRASRKNWPDIVQLGDVRAVTGFGLPEIDLLIGGSPCQDLSSSGSREGLKGVKSSLFYEYVRLLRSLNPRYFLLENVASMRDEDRAIMDEEIGVKSIFINSSVLSCQNRGRLYWTNIPFEMPQGEGPDLQTIIDFEDRTTDRRAQLLIKEKPHILEYFEEERKKRGTKYLLVHRDGTIREDQRKTNTINCYEVGGANGKRVNMVYLPGGVLRLFNFKEKEALQNLPSGYTEGIPGRLKMIGNGWTVDVIAHIFKGLR